MRATAGGGRGVARADDRHGGLVEEGKVALDDEGGRRGFELGEQRRIEALAEEEVARAEALDALDLALDEIAPGQLRGAPAAARGEIGNRVDRRLSRAEAGEQLEIGHGADIVRADQAQPRDLVRRRAHQPALRPTLGSVPWSRRPRLARCFQSTSRAKPAKSMTRLTRPTNQAATGALAAAAIPPTEE